MFYRILSHLVVSVLLAAPPSVPGIYELSFLTNGQPTESILFVGDELVLKAHVTDSFGAPALGGSVTFQFCSRGGGKSYFQMDPAPSRECDIDRTGTWKSLLSMKVNPGTCPDEGPGFACMNFGFISSPRTIGFRFVYREQRSGIESGISTSKDAEWVIP
ncbi:MAG TPA: hypothetical protein VFR18_19840 [Terriglobia bacterium]|nr:hypothetical protein [Terriglobia bacterium]